MEKVDKKLKKVAKIFLEKEIRKEVKDILVSSITDYKELLGMWKSSFGFGRSGDIDVETQIKIEAQMFAVNKTCTNYDELMRRWKEGLQWWERRSRKSNPTKQIEARIFEVNKTCTNYDELIRRWNKINDENDESHLRYDMNNQIKERILVVVEKDKSLQKKLFKEKKGIPSFLKGNLISIAQEILNY